MTTSFPTKTFGLKTPSDLYFKLLHDIDRLKASRFSDVAQYAAFDCAVTAMHIADWLLMGASDPLHYKLCQRKKGERDVMKEFGVQNAKRLPAFEFCRQIANSVKHMVVTKGPKMENMSTGSTVIFTKEFWAGSNDPNSVYPLVYITVDGERTPVIKLFEAMAYQWRAFLSEENLFVDRYKDEADQT